MTPEEYIKECKKVEKILISSNYNSEINEYLIKLRQNFANDYPQEYREWWEYEHPKRYGSLSG